MESSVKVPVMCSVRPVASCCNVIAIVVSPFEILSEKVSLLTLKIETEVPVKVRVVPNVLV